MRKNVSVKIQQQKYTGLILEVCQKLSLSKPEVPEQRGQLFVLENVCGNLLSFVFFTDKKKLKIWHICNSMNIADFKLLNNQKTDFA